MSDSSKPESINTIHINNKNRVCYLLLQVHVPSTHNPPKSDSILQSITVAKKVGKKIGIIVFPVKLKYKSNNKSDYRFVFRFPWYKRNDEFAFKLSEAFFLGLSISFGPWMDPNETISAYCFPSELIISEILLLDDLINFENSLPYPERSIEFPHSLFGHSFTTSESRINVAWELTPVILENTSLRRAAQFLVKSQEDFFVWSGQIQDVIDHAGFIPDSLFDQVKFESALHNAFKSVEAIIGDPPRDDNKLFSLLKSFDLDPLELVGYQSKRPLYEVIRNMNIARDKKSAHGSTPSKNITAGELLEYQSCAKYIVRMAFNQFLGKDIFYVSSENL